MKERRTRYALRAFAVDIAPAGDGDYLPTLRRAYLEKGVRILLLYSKGRLAQDYIDKQGNVSDTISWFCEWGTFLSSHRHRENLMRTPVLKIQEHLLAGEAQNIKDSDNMGDLCICLLIDATDSMNDCIERVKDDLQRGLLTELFIRYGYMGYMDDLGGLFCACTCNARFSCHHKQQAPSHQSTCICDG